MPGDDDADERDTLLDLRTPGSPAGGDEEGLTLPDVPLPFDDSDFTGVTMLDELHLHQFRPLRPGRRSRTQSSWVNDGGGAWWAADLRAELARESLPALDRITRRGLSRASGDLTKLRGWRRATRSR